MIEFTHHLFTTLEQQLLIKLEEVEPVLRLPCLGVDGLQELTHNLDDLRQCHLVRVIFRSVFQDSFEEKRVPGETGRRLR